MLVPICVHYICIILPLRHKYSESLQHQQNWCQIPLLIACHPSRANGGAPVLAPTVALLLQRVLTSVGPTPLPPMPHPVHPSHPSHPGSNQTIHKSQYFLVQLIRYDTIWSNPVDKIRSSDTIQPIQYDPDDKSNNTIQPIQDPSSVASLPHHLYFTPHIQLMPPNLIFHPLQRPLPPDIFSPSLLLHILLSY